MFHPWVTCLPGCNRKTGAVICLFCDYFVIKLSFITKIITDIKFFWSNLSVPSLGDLFTWMQEKNWGIHLPVL